MLASMGGGLIGLAFSLSNPNGIDILSQINGILGALVAVTGDCHYNGNYFTVSVRRLLSFQSLGSYNCWDDRGFHHVFCNAPLGQNAY